MRSRDRRRRRAAARAIRMLLSARRAQLGTAAKGRSARGIRSACRAESGRASSACNTDDFHSEMIRARRRRSSRAPETADAALPRTRTLSKCAGITEPLTERRWNAIVKTSDLDNSKKSAEIHSKQINFLDQDGKFKPLDTNFAIVSPTGEVFLNTKDGFKRESGLKLPASKI